MRKIFFPGSFNPFTKGHADILNRLLSLADHVTIGIGVNSDKVSDNNDTGRKEEDINSYLKREGLEARVEVITYSGLTAEKAIEIGADCMARGVRGASDFEYESALANANREVFGIETILIPAKPELSYVSSSMIRDLKANGREDLASRFLP